MIFSALQIQLNSHNATRTVRLFFHFIDEETEERNAKRNRKQSLASCIPQILPRRLERSWSKIRISGGAPEEPLLSSEELKCYSGQLAVTTTSPPVAHADSCFAAMCATRTGKPGLPSRVSGDHRHQNGQHGCERGLQISFTAGAGARAPSPAPSSATTNGQARLG